MILPRPPFWYSRPVRALRRVWHRAGLPCPFCRLELGEWRP